MQPARHRAPTPVPLRGASTHLRIPAQPAEFPAGKLDARKMAGYARFSRVDQPQDRPGPTDEAGRSMGWWENLQLRVGGVDARVRAVEQMGTSSDPRQV